MIANGDTSDDTSQKALSFELIVMVSKVSHIITIDLEAQKTTFKVLNFIYLNIRINIL